MNSDTMQKLKTQFFSIAATAILGATIAVMQNFLEMHGMSCGVTPSPALAAGSGAFLKGIHTAFLGMRDADA